MKAENFVENVENVKVPFSDMKEWSQALFQAVGMDEEDAEITADNLVTADLRGVYSHGVMRVPIYVKRLQVNVTSPTAKYEVIRDSKATALIEGHNAMGQVVGKHAMDLAAKKAKEYGVGYVAVRGSNHYGASAHFAQMVLSEDMIGMTGTIGGNIMAPWGGTDRRLGNNPFAIAIPALTKEPIVLDMANSVVARGKIVLAKKTNQPIPDDWAFAPDGTPTTDATDGYNGTVQPVGGYKGYGLTFITGILSSILSGAAFGQHLTDSDLYEEFTIPQNIGHYMQAIDIASFIDPELFKRQIDEAIEYMHNSPKAKGVERIYVPGEPEALKAKKQMEEGIQYPLSMIEELKELSQELGVSARF
ncbi:Ldh family oxidoreductase [Halalkalibacter oceani]|uniref:Ldh family oxidoreductase n=1 Tax=Halalkalibacter oceani TaxID=1653776 RepID=A0A9X2IRM3_9BACI|nr:Ldh family oxidoreductase [Halalkalibacter oceani]MCM3715733.1 Ldh family oxidoreductase [Halalkalibacter oceani]